MRTGPRAARARCGSTLRGCSPPRRAVTGGPGSGLATCERLRGAASQLGGRLQDLPREAAPVRVADPQCRDRRRRAGQSPRQHRKCQRHHEVDPGCEHRENPEARPRRGADSGGQPDAAAVVRPRTESRRTKISPAPRNPAPVTSCAAIRDGSRTTRPGSSTSVNPLVADQHEQRRRSDTNHGVRAGSARRRSPASVGGPFPQCGLQDRSYLGIHGECRFGLLLLVTRWRQQLGLELSGEAPRPCDKCRLCVWAERWRRFSPRGDRLADQAKELFLACGRAHAQQP